MERHDPAEDEAPHISARDARGGEIILRTRARRWIFLAGLIGFVLLVIGLALARP